MGLLSFFRRDKSKPRSVQRGREDIALVRVRARRRLIGAIVLVTAAVVGLPWLLETQPRPLSADIATDVSRDSQSAPASVAASGLRPPSSDLRVGSSMPPTADTAVPAVLPVSPVAAAPVRVQASAQPVAPGQRQATAAVTPINPVTTAVPAPTVHAPVPKVVPAPRPVPAPVRMAPAQAEARPLPPTRATVPAKADEARGRPPAEVRPAAPVASRFVVQVGAFEHATAARETRGKVEKLGLKAYEQEVDAGGARRIRVRLGPYASREEAERMLARLRASGMNASVMPQ
ncbi:MAG: hypothetical protein RLZZ584_192 [Pseudomonadota bacterium]|jgi:DedD protein